MTFAGVVPWRFRSTLWHGAGTIVRRIGFDLVDVL